MHMKINNLLFFLIIMFIVGCAINEDGILRDNKGNILSSSKTEIEETQRALLNAQAPNNLPNSAEGGVLFDGKVVWVDINPMGLYSTLFEVDNILFGDLKGEQKIIIYSPSPQKTGIDFKKGEIYRVFTVYLNGAYRTWDWLGTFRVDDDKQPE